MLTPTMAVRDTGLLSAIGFGVYALVLREKLVAELSKVRTVQASDFPPHVPLLLERAHRFSFPTSPRLSKFRFAYIAAIISLMTASIGTILLNLGL